MMVHMHIFFVLFRALIIFLFILATTANGEHHDLNHHDDSTGVKLPLVHRDKLLSSSSSSSHNDDYRRARVLSGLGPGFGMAVENPGAGGDYYVTLGVGSPPTDQTLSIDTGSDLTWIQCEACIKCFPQPHQRFDPTRSSHSLRWVTCDSDTCNLLENMKSKCSDQNNNQCGYDYWYGFSDEQTYTSGSLALETLTINGTAFPSVIMGCSNDNSISFHNLADGMLGLGRGSLSYTTQPNGQTGQAFRFCLGENGWLHFGRSNFPGNHSKWASLILNDKYPSFYYVELLRIEVEGKALGGIPEKTFQIDPKKGKGGVIIDTGTSHTYLPKVAYNALRDTVNGYLDYKLFNPITSPDPKLFDTCYNLGSGVDLRRVTLPLVSFIFQGMYVQSTPIIQVNATNILREMDTKDINIACLAFSASKTDFNILGGRQLENIQISIDAAGGFIGFGPSGCVDS